MIDDPVGAATALVRERFPGAVAAFLGGTVLGPLRTPTSDLDVVVVLPEGAGAFRETVTYAGWTAELFVNTTSGLRRLVAREVAARRSPLIDMLGGGVVLAGGATARALAGHARELAAAGPPPATDEEMADLRYGVSDLLDDLRGASDPGEMAFVAVRLLDAAARLALTAGGSWLGTGKWLGRRLAAHDPGLHRDLLAGLRAALAGDTGPLDAATVSVLDRVGGPRLAGYRREAPRPPVTGGVEPQLDVRRGREAVDFYRDAFGAAEVYRVGGTDADPAVVSRLRVGDGSFWVADEAPAYGHASPETLGATTGRLLLVTEDPAAVQARAVALGAVELMPVTAKHGWLLGRVRDPYGHLWEIGRELA
jgi:uncharacterized glyoxalase superfamily protein PhnB